MKKRLLAAIMSLCMIVSLLPVSALAVEDEGTVPVVEETVPLETTGTEAVPQSGPEYRAEKYGVHLDFQGSPSVKLYEEVTITVGNWTGNGFVKRDILGGNYYVEVANLIPDRNSQSLKATVTSKASGYSGTANLTWVDRWIADDYYTGTISDWSKPSQSDKDAYFYVVDPAVATSAIEGRDTELFEYVGKGSVGGSIPAANHPRVTPHKEKI